MRLALLALALLATGVAAHADTFSTFTLNSTFALGGSINGSLILDTTTSQFSSANLTASGFQQGSGTISSIYSQGTSNGEYVVHLIGPESVDLTLELPVLSLSGYTGSSICTSATLGSANCPLKDGTNYGGVEGVVALSGSLTLVPATPPVTTVTPEPTSIILLGTGLASLTGLIRRRSLTPAA